MFVILFKASIQQLKASRLQLNFQTASEPSAVSTLSDTYCQYVHQINQAALVNPVQPKVQRYPTTMELKL